MRRKNLCNNQLLQSMKVKKFNNHWENNGKELTTKYKPQIQVNPSEQLFPLSGSGYSFKFKEVVLFVKKKKKKRDTRTFTF